MGFGAYGLLIISWEWKEERTCLHCYAASSPGAEWLPINNCLERQR